jgi:hypothetical protein
MNKLEQEFKAEIDQINAKIKEAANAMKEANQIAKGIKIARLSEVGYDEDGENFIEMHLLFRELQVGGWRTSSLNPGC